MQGYYVSGTFFETLEVRAELGRVLTPADDRRGCAGTAVISDDLWRTEYNASLDILEKTITLNGHRIPIIGVAQPGFSGIDVGTSIAVMVPVCAEDLIRVHPAQILDTNAMQMATGIYGWLKILGRLKPGISAPSAEVRLNSLAPTILQSTTLPARWSPEDRRRYLSRTFAAQPIATGLSDLRTVYGKALGLLMAISGIVLLIACANVANLLMSRTLSREREIGIRIALGSNKGRLVRLLLCESFLLSASGTMMAVLLARTGVAQLVKFLNISLHFGLDARVLIFNAAVAAVTALVIGVAPALRGARVNPGEAMKAGRHAPSPASRLINPRNLFVAAQISLTFVLVVCAGLMISTFSNLNSMDPGFKPEPVLLARVDFRNGDPARERRVWQILDSLRGLPRVEMASISGNKPLCGCYRDTTVKIEGPGEQDTDTVFLDEVSDGYFQTLGIPLLHGREFNAFDTTGSPPVAVVNEAMAKKFFGARNPVGRHLRTVNGNTLGPRIEIVGIVRDMKLSSMRESAVPAVFRARRQDSWIDFYYEFELRALGAAPASLIPKVTAAVGQIDRDAVLEFTTLSKRLNDSLDRDRLLATLSGYFGMLASVLAVIGLHGTVAYNIAVNRKNIGIRLALGATPGRVLRMVMEDAAFATGVGLAVGLTLALWTTRLTESFLFGVTPNDAVMLARAFALLAGTAFLDSYLLARRASQLDPLTMLREE